MSVSEDSSSTSANLDGHSFDSQLDDSDDYILTDFFLDIPKPPQYTGKRNLMLEMTPTVRFDEALRAGRHHASHGDFLSPSLEPPFKNSTEHYNKERSKMSLKDLMSIYHAFKTNLAYETIIPEVDFDEYGLLAAEQKEGADDYQDAISSEDQLTPSSVRTRSQVSQLTSRIESDTETDSVSSSCRPSSSQNLLSLSSASTASSNCTDLNCFLPSYLQFDDTDVISEANYLHHLPFSSLEEELLIVQSVLTSIHGKSQISLSTEFTRIASSMIPNEYHEWINIFGYIFLLDLSGQPETQSDQTLRNICGDKLDINEGKKLYLTIRQIILFSPVSESECERVFSSAHNITGKRRYNLGLRTLNYLLLVSRYSSVSTTQDLIEATDSLLLKKKMPLSKRPVS